MNDKEMIWKLVFVTFVDDTFCFVTVYIFHNVWAEKQWIQMTFQIFMTKQ